MLESMRTLRERLLSVSKVDRLQSDGLTAKTGLFVSDYAHRNEPADADAVVRSRAFEESFKRREAERLPNELRERCICAVRQSVDDAEEREEVCLRI